MFSISIAMATYNGAGFIAEQLASFAAQTRLPDELVVTDDGSTDATLDIVERFAATAPFPVRIHRNPARLGYRANFMSNFDRCRSELIAVSDQDDIWHPEKLEIAAAAFDDPETLLFCHDAWLVDAEARRLGGADIIRLPPRSPPLSFYPFINPLGFTIVFRRALLDFSEDWQASLDTWEPGNRMAHDQWLCFIASTYGTIAFSDEKLVDYRQHGGNAYGWKPGSLWARYRYKLRNPGETYLTLSRAATARAVILEREMATRSPAWQQRAADAASLYRRLAETVATRAGIYLHASLRQRIAAIRSLLAQRAYAEATPWDLSRKSLAKDVVFGIALRPVLSNQRSRPAAPALRTDPQPRS